MSRSEITLFGRFLMFYQLSQAKYTMSHLNCFIIPFFSDEEIEAKTGQMASEDSNRREGDLISACLVRT